MLPADAFALSNADDDYGMKMLEGIKAKKYTYGAKNQADFSEKPETKLLGKFNEYNTLAVYAAAVLLGATLEEYLRGWVEASGLNLGSRNPSLNKYMAILLQSDLITKQDSKDIQAWGGLRNHAAHGEWSEVENRQRVSLMLEGVNLFMRKYESSSSIDAG